MAKVLWSQNQSYINIMIRIIMQFYGCISWQMYIQVRTGNSNHLSKVRIWGLF